MWDFCTRPAFNGLWKHIKMLTKCTKFMTQSLNCIVLYTVCFGILIVSLNTTFYLFFHVYTEISQNVWSWKFGLKSWKSIGQNVYEPCHSLTHTHSHTHTLTHTHTHTLSHTLTHSHTHPHSHTHIRTHIHTHTHTYTHTHTH